MDNPAKISAPVQNPAIAADSAVTTWLEIGAVVLLFCAPTLSSLGRSLFWSGENPTTARQRRQAEHETAAAFERRLFDSSVLHLRFVPVVLLVMWRSGQGFARFGLVKPRLMKDILIGLCLWLAVTCLSAVIAHIYDMPHSWLPAAVPLAFGLLILIEACVVGFAEELTYRAYLIPRVQSATGAAWIGLVLSVALFGFVHMYKGKVGVMHSLAAAVVWGMGFCLTRRIWPVALSHAMIDFIVHTHFSAADVG